MNKRAFTTILLLVVMIIGTMATMSFNLDETVEIAVINKIEKEKISLTEDESSNKEAWERQVLFGEQHMHTRKSGEAFTIGVNNAWEDA